MSVFDAVDGMFDLGDFVQRRFFDAFQTVLIFKVCGLFLEIGRQKLVHLPIDMRNAGFELLQTLGQGFQNGCILGHRTFFLVILV